MQDVGENNTVAWTLYYSAQNAGTKFNEGQEKYPDDSDGLRSLLANFGKRRRLLLRELDEIRVDETIAEEESSLKAGNPAAGPSHFSSKST